MHKSKPAAKKGAPAAKKAAAPAAAAKGKDKKAAAPAPAPAPAPAAAPASAKGKDKKAAAPAPKGKAKGKAAAAVVVVPKDSAAPIKKLKKSLRGNKASEVEKLVAKTLFDLECANKNLKTALANLTINSAKEIQFEKKKALVIFYPLRFIRKYRKIQKTLTQELEKKFSGTHVIMIAQRRMQRPPKSNMASRQRSRCLTAVHDSILEDMVYPADIVAKRWVYSMDGTQRLQVFFDQREKDRVESKIDTFEKLYQKLTGRESRFSFMKNAALQSVE